MSELISIKESITLLLEHEIINYALPFFFLFILGEMWINYLQGKEHFEGKDSITSIVMGLGSSGFNILAKGSYFILYVWLYENFRIFELGFTWWAWILCLFADDFSFYWHHRMSHQIRILWAAHSVHHSSEHYNLSTALRQSWTEWFHKYFFWLWMPIVGFHPIMIATMMSISLIYQFYLHTEKIGKLGFLEIFMNTPSHHRVHHGTNIRYLDRNHAGILIIWDKMFGTFEPELDEEPVIYGLTDNIKTFNPFKVAVIEYMRIYRSSKSKSVSFLNKLKYLIKPPGWRHDQESKTTEQLRKEHGIP